MTAGARCENEKEEEEEEVEGGTGRREPAKHSTPVTIPLVTPYLYTPISILAPASLRPGFLGRFTETARLAAPGNALEYRKPDRYRGMVLPSLVRPATWVAFADSDANADRMPIFIGSPKARDSF